MTEARHDAARRAQLAQPLASNALRPLDHVLTVEVLKHEGRLRREGVGRRYYHLEILVKQRPGPDALRSGAVLGQDDQIRIALQHGFAELALRASFDSEFEIRNAAAHAVEDLG